MKTDLEKLKDFILNTQAMAEQGEFFMLNVTDILNEIERMQALPTADVESVIELSPFNNVVKSLGDTKRKYTIWHDGGEWMVSLEPDAMNNCKTLAEFLKGC